MNIQMKSIRQQEYGLFPQFRAQSVRRSFKERLDLLPQASNLRQRSSLTTISRLNKGAYNNDRSQNLPKLIAKVQIDRKLFNPSNQFKFNKAKGMHPFRKRLY
jgi:hypothetical protein